MKVTTRSDQASDWSLVPGKRGISNTVRATQGTTNIPAAADLATPAAWVELVRAVVKGVGLVNISARIQATSGSTTRDSLYLTFQWSKDGGTTWLDINLNDSQICGIPAMIGATNIRFERHHEETLTISGHGKVVIRLVGYHSNVHPSAATAVHASALFVQGNIVESKV